jgi:lysophospholipase L1-like esterase
MQRRAVACLVLTAWLALGGCTVADRPSQEERTVRYVALGDSYTIGTSVEEAERWPNQLVGRIPSLELVGNPAVNGYTSADLIRDELPLLDGLDPELATVLIGVNDVVQGVPDERYAANVARILDDLVERLGSDRVVCVATPDYTVTPRGADYGDPMQQSEGIARLNAILGDACSQRGVVFVPDIYAISQEARDDRSLVASDGLHPSGAQYGRWVDVIAPVVEALLDR